MSNMWYGSLQNRIEERAKQPEPVVGMGVTEMCWSDRHPFEIIQVKDSRHIVVRALDHKRIDNNGMSECQEYEYTSNEKNITCNLFKTQKGRWRERMPDRTLGSTHYVLGFAEEYYDFSF